MRQQGGARHGATACWVAMPSRAQALSPIVLPDTNGLPVRLGTLWEAAPAVVVFLRHYG
jgi:hypothetical protein